MAKLKVLIAEWDQANIDKLKEALVKDDYEVVVGKDGVEALQVALHGDPDFVIISLDLPLIDGVKLSQIIRTNPKTEAIPIFYMNDRAIQLSHFRRNTDYFIIKPFNADEIRKILASAKKTLIDMNSMNKEEEFSGNLRQMSLPDLLQVLAMNRRTGNLFIELGQDDKNKKVLVAIEDGKIINARFDKATKTKAFFRILVLKEGHFVFVPGRPELAQEIRESTDSIIMEGLRQNDEMAEMRKKLPGEKVRVQLRVSIDKLPKGLRPKTMEVLSAIDVFHDLDDLMDNVNVQDYDILKIIIGLKEKGVVKLESDVREAEASAYVFASDSLLDLKKKLARISQNAATPYNISLVVFINVPEMLNKFLKALEGFNFAPSKNDLLALRKGERKLGFLGTIKLVETLRVNLFYFCGIHPSRPLLESFGSMTAGALIIGDKEKHRDVVTSFGKRNVSVGPKEKLDTELLAKCLEKLFEAYSREG